MPNEDLKKQIVVIMKKVTVNYLALMVATAFLASGCNGLKKMAQNANQIQRSIRQLAQKEYDQRVLRSAEQEEKLVRKLQAFYMKQSDPEALFDKTLPSKRIYINPIRETDVDFVRRWRAEPYKGLDFRNDSQVIYTDRGERVRSKTEMIIANLLNKKSCRGLNN